MKNTASRVLNGVVLVVHNTRVPDRKEWDEYLTAVATARDGMGRDFASFRQLVITDGGVPSSAQRKAFAEIVRAGENVDKLKVAIVSRNFSVRGIATALRWMGFPVRSFDPEQLAEAFACLAVSSSDAIALCTAIEELCATINGSVRSAARISAYRRKLSGGSPDVPSRDSVAPRA